MKTLAEKQRRDRMLHEQHKKKEMARTGNYNDDDDDK